MVRSREATLQSTIEDACWMMVNDDDDESSSIIPRCVDITGARSHDLSPALTQGPRLDTLGASAEALSFEQARAEVHDMLRSAEWSGKWLAVTPHPRRRPACFLVLSSCPFPIFSCGLRQCTWVTAALLVETSGARRPAGAVAVAGRHGGRRARVDAGGVPVGARADHHHDAGSRVGAGGGGRLGGGRGGAAEVRPVRARRAERHDAASGRCRLVHYCSIDCQTAAWGKHKGACLPRRSVADVTGLSVVADP
jgi:hypothetical protein